MKNIAVAVVVLVSSLMVTTLGFTIGTMIPNWLCGLANDGYPKAVSTVLPFLKLGTAIDNYNEYPIGNGTIQITLQQGNVTTGAHPAPASQIIGGFHNGNASYGNFTKGVTNPVLLVPSTANAQNGSFSNFVISPGKNYTFALVVNAIGFNNMNEALDGGFAYAMDTVTGNRVGQWINAGATFSVWPACQINTNVIATGIVHNQVITNVSSITNLIWQAPTSISGTIKFIGAGVTDGGYGAWSVEYNTTASSAAPSLTPMIRVDTANALATFGPKYNAAADFAYTANAVYTTTTTTTGLSQGATAGIAIACGLVGIAAGFFVFPKIVKRRGTDEKRTPLML